MSAPSLPSSGLVMTPRGLFNFSASANSATTQDYQITSPLLNMGVAMLCMNAMAGDTVDLYLIDKNNVLGNGSTPSNPVIIQHFARALGVFPNLEMAMDNPSIPNSMIVGLFIRIKYTSIGLLSSVNVIVNMRAYEQILDFAQDSG